jgi:hypothetical protein
MIGWQKLIVPCHYRPFDKRAVLYDKRMVDWGRWDVMGHLVGGQNLGLVAIRQSVVDEDFSHTYVSDSLIDNRAFYSNKGIPSLFPLWLHPKGKPTRPNLAPTFIQSLASSLGQPTEPERHDLPEGVLPEDVLAYVYAVLHAPSYRSRYAEFLKSDFPRIPVAVDAGSAQTFAQVWRALLPLGHTLIDLHLLRKVPPGLQPRFPVAGDNGVEKPRFVAGPSGENGALGRVYINASQFFDGVPQATWEFKVGGYQVCEKWLKDRKGRTLTLDDIEHYQKTAAALTQTRALMAQIDTMTNGALWPSA